MASGCPAKVKPGVMGLTWKAGLSEVATSLPAEATTLKQWWEEKFEAPDSEPGLYAEPLRASTMATYSSHMHKHILPSLGDSLSRLTKADVQAWLEGLQKKKVGVPTRNACLRVLKRVLETAVESEVIATNPAHKVKAPKVPTRKQRPLTVEEAWLLADVVPQRYRALVLLMPYTGMRIGEATFLQLKHLDAMLRSVQVEGAFSEVNGKLIPGPPKTEAGARKVAIPKRIRVELAHHIEQFVSDKEPEALVFTGPRGGPIQRTRFLKRVWKPALEKAGIKQPWPTEHDCRHTQASWAVKAGSHPKEIQVRLGHSSSKITLDRYSHLMDGMDEDLADRLDALVDSSTVQELSMEVQAEVLPLKKRPFYQGI
jgi:integrase